MKNMLLLDKFTLKAQEAIQNALQFAEELCHREILPEHLLAALLQDKEGIIPQIVERINIPIRELSKRLEGELNTKAKVEGSQPFISHRLNKVLSQAQKIATGMKDEYVSLEHIFLALYKEEDGLLNQELRKNGIKEEDILRV